MTGLSLRSKPGPAPRPAPRNGGLLTMPDIATITTQQRRRFFAIAQEQGWTMVAIRDFLQRTGI